MSIVCKECHAYKQFKEKCWFYWQEKKECSKFVPTEMSGETHRSVKEDFDIVQLK